MKETLTSITLKSGQSYYVSTGDPHALAWRISSFTDESKFRHFIAANGSDIWVRASEIDSIFVARDLESDEAPATLGKRSL